MRKMYFLVAFFIASSHIFAQVQLQQTGQSQYSAAFHVNWDSSGQKLIVGAGAIIKVFDLSDTNNIQLIAKRPLLGLINETDVYNNVLFVAATHHGVFALDYSSDSLRVLAHFNMQQQNNLGAYDMWRSNDTLFIADNFKVRMLRYNSSGSFTDLGYIGPPNSFCVSRKGNLIAIGTHGLVGKVEIYDIHNLSSPLASWQSNKIWYQMDLQFADLRNDIIYVCGGPADLLNTKSWFLALQYQNNSINLIDSILIDGGVPGLAQINIMNMDSRNDTVYLATTAAWNGSTFPNTYVPVIDASNLPLDTMKQVGHIIAGLWHFDVAVMTGTPYLAIASEWLGALISEAQKLNPLDTLGFIGTGGWCVNARLRGDTIWACHEGNGVRAYKTDSLLFHYGFDTDANILHIKKSFTSDVCFPAPSTLLLSTGDMYDLSNWYTGGQPTFMASLPHDFVRMEVVETNTGTRLVGSHNNLLGLLRLILIDPFDSLNNYPTLYIDTIANSATSLAYSGDTIYAGKKINNVFHLAAFKAQNDQLLLLDTIVMADEVLAVDIEGSKIAAACKNTISWLSWNGNSLQEEGNYSNIFLHANDIELKNNFIYVSDKFSGLKIYDISLIPVNAEVAFFNGSEGWLNLFGSTAVVIGDQAEIYCCDYHAGVISVQCWDSNFMPNPFVPEIERSSNVLVYPNPADDRLCFNFPALWGNNVYCSIYDISGKTLGAFPANADIPVKNLSDGIYIFRLYNESEFLEGGIFSIKHE